MILKCEILTQLNQRKLPSPSINSQCCWVETEPTVGLKRCRWSTVWNATFPSNALVALPRTLCQRNFMKILKQLTYCLKCSGTIEIFRCALLTKMVTSQRIVDIWPNASLATFCNCLHLQQQHGFVHFEQCNSLHASFICYLPALWTIQIDLPTTALLFKKDTVYLSFYRNTKKLAPMSELCSLTRFV